MIKKGLVSVSFRGNTPKEIMNACQSTGIKWVEWGSDIHAPCDDTARLKEIAALQKEYGIQTSSYGTYFRVGLNDTLDIDKYISAAEVLGTDTLRIWCGDKGSELYSSEEKEALLLECIRLSERAEKAGVRLCFEYHPNTFTDTWESSLFLMRRLCKPGNSMKMYWQPNQYRTNEENILSVTELSPYIENVHVFNWSGNKKLPLEGAREIWREYFERLSGEHFALLEFMPDGKLESLACESESLDKILNNCH